MFTLGLEGCLMLILGCALLGLLIWMVYDDFKDE
jgi:hypothetical protein